jgi:hypothetical protein
MENNTVVSSDWKRRVISIDFALHLPWEVIYCRIKLYSEFWYTGRFTAKYINEILGWNFGLLCS